jgi:hypothetical protein
LGVRRRTTTPTAVDILNRRLARGEIDGAEYGEKRRLRLQSLHAPTMLLVHFIGDVRT